METTYQLIPSNTGYIQHEDGTVFKIMNDYYLKLSPWNDKEDRRVQEIDLGNSKMITYKNACMIVNSQFDNINEEWEHNGKKYIASSVANKNSLEHTYLLSTLPSHKIFVKTTEKLVSMLGQNNLSISSPDGSQEMKLVKHKGKMYYILIVNEFLPRVQAYNMFGEFCQWIGLDHCKPVFNVTDKRYI